MTQLYLISESYLPLVLNNSDANLHLTQEDIDTFKVQKFIDLQSLDTVLKSPLYQDCVNRDNIFTERELECVLSTPLPQNGTQGLSNTDYVNLSLLYLDRFEYQEYYPPYLKSILEKSSVTHVRPDTKQNEYVLETNEDLVLSKSQASQSRVSFPGVADCHVIVAQNLTTGEIYFGHISPSGSLERLEQFLNANDAQFDVQIYRSTYGATHTNSLQKLQSIYLLLEDTLHNLNVQILGDMYFDVTLKVDSTLQIQALHIPEIF